jgi:hypothetical protein
MSARSSFVVMESAALDETPTKEIILRGVVTSESLSCLMVDDYQREAMPLSSQASILKALTSGQTLPDIELGMRGGRFKEKEEGVFTLQDPVYIIDGLQRVNTGLHILATKPGVPVRIGATIHFNTTKEWEIERFRVLNTLRLKVSPNVLLRNKRDDSSAISLLYNLSNNDKSFALHERVSWSQRMSKGELISALGLAKVTGVLHSHKAATRRTAIEELVPALDKAVELVGTNNMRANVSVFFDVIDECWGIKRVQYREGAAYIKGAFLTVLARVFSDHRDFWRQEDEKRLVVEASLRRKIGQFPIHDPNVVNLASSGGKSREILYVLIRDHINNGKRTKRITARNGDMIGPIIDDDENGRDAAEE